MKCKYPLLGNTMASISLSGKLVGKKSDPAVALRKAGDISIAEFSVMDTDYCYFKNKDDNPGQFYKVSVASKSAEWLAENLTHGSKVTVHGQPVWREYNAQKFLDVKNARVVSMDDRKPAQESNSLF